MSRPLLCLFLVPALSAPAWAGDAGAGHVGLMLSMDAYSDETFEAGQDDDARTTEPGTGALVRYMAPPDLGPDWLPTLGIGAGRWGSRLEGSCCGFADEHARFTFTAVDLLVGNLSRSGDVHEAWYLLLGGSSVDVEPTFDAGGVEGLTSGRQRGGQVGFGFFAGTAGGFSGGFEARYTQAGELSVTNWQISVGMGF